MKTAEKLQVPFIGLKVFCKDESAGFKIPMKFYHGDAEVTQINKGKAVAGKREITGITLTFYRDGSYEKINQDLFLNFKEGGLEEFWESFEAKAEQTFCYDPNFIWIASDGDGGYYSYDSEEACQDYASKNGEEGSVASAGRGAFDKAGPEMYVCLSRVLEHLRKYQGGKMSGIELANNLMKIYPRIDSACADLEKHEDTKNILKLLKLDNIA